MSVIIVAGRQCSGKSTFAESLAADLGSDECDLLEEDDFRGKDGQVDWARMLSAVQNSLFTYVLVIGVAVASCEALRNLANGQTYLVQADPDVCLGRWLERRILFGWSIPWDALEKEWYDLRKIYDRYLLPYLHHCTVVDGQRASLEAGLVFKGLRREP